MKALARRGLLVLLGTAGLVAASATPALAGTSFNHTEPLQ